MPSNRAKRLFNEIRWVCECPHLSEAVQTDKEGGQGVLVMTLGVAPVRWHGCHHICRTPKSCVELNDFVLCSRLNPCTEISNEGSESSGMFAVNNI